ncbi:uncharacterized protein LTR77_003781 [Saxophila tyrrhenica]|uniref:NAD(P)-binding domain-containing protein n=1 Tax=Saxophila tyrrhenica TaxID=1690608 RepID=A0AAV9PER4_9PEZI|nr:hypothetical protein LTR77_003781 [Saxophila tyrrhenica]
MRADAYHPGTKGDTTAGSLEQGRLTLNVGPRSLGSRFFADDGLWRNAPILTGKGSFPPLPDVHNILVTGGEGFIASWLVRHLVTKYPEAYTVISFDKLDYCSSRHNARMLESRPNFRFVHGNVTNEDDVVECLKRYQIDTIFHLAAHTHVDNSFGNSYAFNVNNDFGTHVLLESVRKVDTVRRLYHISTDEVFGEVETGQGDLKEHSLLKPTNPYAATKASAEMMVNAFAKSFKIPAVVIRLNNIYGPHQYPEKIIPKFTNLLRRQMPLFIHGDGKHTRRYLYAGDAVDAFDTILHKGVLGEIYNVDSRDEVSNFELATKLLGMFGITNMESWIQWTPDRPFNDRRYAVDGSKLRRLGWTQRVTFDTGLAATVDWYSKFSRWWGAIDNTILAAFPVVKDGQVIGPAPNEPSHIMHVQKETTAGAVCDVQTVATPAGNGEVLTTFERTGKKRPADEAVGSMVAAEIAQEGPFAVSVECNGGASPKKRKVEVLD